VGKKWKGTTGVLILKKEGSLEGYRERFESGGEAYVKTGNERKGKRANKRNKKAAWKEAKQEGVLEKKNKGECISSEPNCQKKKLIGLIHFRGGGYSLQRRGLAD